MTCRGIVWPSTVPLNGPRLWAQAFFSRELTSLDRLSSNPISFPAIAKQYVHPMSLEISKEKAEISLYRKRELKQMRSRLREIGETAYNEDTYRRPMGVGIL
jgi:hypothetical protein